MPNKIVAGLATFGTVVWNGLQAGVQFISDNWAGWVAGLLLFFSELPGKIIDALAGIGEFVWNGTKTAFGVPHRQGVGVGVRHRGVLHRSAGPHHHRCR
jgi:hypothetical protein